MLLYVIVYITCFLYISVIIYSKLFQIFSMKVLEITSRISFSKIQVKLMGRKFNMLKVPYSNKQKNNKQTGKKTTQFSVFSLFKIA